MLERDALALAEATGRLLEAEESARLEYVKALLKQIAGRPSL